MSKLEDKLTASIKPGRQRTAEKSRPVKPAAKPAQAVVAAGLPSAKVGAGSTAAQSQGQPLHPGRIWPD